LNAAIDNTENMDVNDPSPDTENMIDDSVQPSPEKTNDQKDVGLDVET